MVLGSKSPALVLYIPPVSSGSSEGQLKEFQYSFDDNTKVRATSSWGAVKRWLIMNGRSVEVQELSEDMLLGDPFAVVRCVREFLGSQDGAGEVLVDITRGDRSKALAVFDAIHVLRKLLPDVSINIVHAGIRVAEDTYRVVFFTEVGPAAIAKEWFDLDIQFIDHLKEIQNLLAERRRCAAHGGSHHEITRISSVEKAVGFVNKVFFHLFYAVAPDGPICSDFTGYVDILRKKTGIKSVDQEIKVLADLLEDLFASCKHGDDRLCFLRFYVEYGHAYRAILFATELLKSYARDCILNPSEEYGHTRQVSELIHARSGEDRDTLIRMYSRPGCESVLNEILNALDDINSIRNTLAHGANPQEHNTSRLRDWARVEILRKKLFKPILRIYSSVSQQASRK